MGSETEKQTLNVEDIAKRIIDDVLKIQAAEQWQYVNLAIVRIQRAARQLLVAHWQKPTWVDGLVEYIDAVEMGGEVRGKDLEQQLILLDVAGAKIRNRLAMVRAVFKAETDLGIGQAPSPLPSPRGREGDFEGDDCRVVANG